ncbi:phage gene 29 protein family protein [Nocardia sp. NPDC055002]
MLPTQETANWEDPEERVVWALRNLPNTGGAAQVTHPDNLRKWSKHIDECGFMHVSELRALACEDGFIHVSQLREQVIEFQPVVRGPRHDYNPATQWVEAGTPAPEVMRLPDINKLTVQENAVMLAQYEAAGLISRPTEHRDSAYEINIPEGVENG